MEILVTAVGAFEAKTRLSELIERAASGEEIVITRRGAPVAKLVAISPRDDAAAAIGELRRLRRGRMLGGLTWKALRDEGRR